MAKKIMAYALTLLTLLSLFTACSTKKTDYKIAMVTDGNSISDNHLNQAVWKGLELIEEEYRADINFYRPSNSEKESIMEGIKTLVDEGYNIIALPGVLFSDALELAAAQYSNVYFIAVDCILSENPAPNIMPIAFDKGQAGFMAGFASAMEHDDMAYGGVLGGNDARDEEIVTGFIQGVNYAIDNYGRKADVNIDNFIFLSDRRDYPRGQKEAATLFENGIQTLLVSSGPTGLGAAAEARMRRGAGDEAIAFVGSEADMSITGYYNADLKLSAAMTSAWCDYETAVFEAAKYIIDGGSLPLGTTIVFDLATDSVGIPEENPNLSQATLDECQVVKGKIFSGEIIIASTVN